MIVLGLAGIVWLSGFSSREAIAFGAVPTKKNSKKPIAKAAKKSAVKSAKRSGVLSRFLGKKKAPVKAKKAPVKKTPAKKAPIKKVPIKKAAAKKPLEVKKIPVKPNIKAPMKTALTSSTAKGGATTISVYKPEPELLETAIVAERRLVLPPPVRPIKTGKKAPQLKPIKSAPAPLVVKEGEDGWSVTEMKAMRSELAKDLVRLKKELQAAESEMDDLIKASGVGAGDDQADAGTKTFEREHEMSLVYNARDMVTQTERALERIDTKTYGRCEDCSSPIGKARLQVFPRATLCMACKQKEERR